MLLDFIRRLNGHESFDAAHCGIEEGFKWGPAAAQGPQSNSFRPERLHRSDEGSRAGIETVTKPLIQ